MASKMVLMKARKTMTVLKTILLKGQMMVAVTVNVMEPMTAVQMGQKSPTVLLFL